MSLHEDLIDQARMLVTLDARRPKQASLRRAVSTSYYTLFHMLVGEAVSMLVPDRALQFLVSRAFVHTEMKDASRSFTETTLPKHLAEVWSGTIPSELQEVAKTFIDLQAERHKADYKINHGLKRREALELVNRVETAFQQWERVKTQPIARLFLASLLLGKKLKHGDR